jgi:uncharacterized protein
MMNSVVHFELPYDDAARVTRFYERAFRWEMRALGKEVSEYVLATTVESDELGPTKPGAINGGLFPRKPDWPSQTPAVVIEVEDLDAASARVKKAGGTVLGDPMEIPGVGRYVAFTDTEGNRLSMLERPLR